LHDLGRGAVLRTVPIYQNDARLADEPSLAPYGCLATTIRQICESRAGHALEPDTVLEWYRWLKDHRHIQDDSELRAYVLDHTAVGQAAQYYLGVPQSFSYCYRHDLRGDRSRNFGDPAEPNAWIAQVRCRGWSISHFLESDGAGNRMWDPYWPPREITVVLSIRGYVL
jgi:hypothetical protein